MKKTIILETKDYTKFESDESNRSTKKLAIRKLVSSMTKYGWLAAYPMHVAPKNGRLNIIDGQHRFSAAKRLGIPVLYVVCEEIEGFHVSEVNVAQSAWTIRDFVTSYANQGKTPYIKLLDYCERHDIPLGVGAKLLKNSLTEGDSCAKSLREGNLKIAPGSLADQVASLVRNLRTNGVSFAANRSFIDALMKCCLVPEFCQERFIQKAKSHPGRLTLQPTTERFLESIEDVYNYCAAKSNKLPLKFHALNAANK
jgi:hypothetical protein